MAGRTTQAYKNTLSGSVGAGMGSLFNPGGKKYYILENKMTGKQQEIIVDNIEIGRDSRCQVRFDERFKTVSRHHAGIVKDGDGWKLVQISKTNSTLLNGRKVDTEWYLQNGDEIQLSLNGPKLGFIIPTGKKSTVASIGLTRRLSLFRQQALRPYKTAITVLSCVLVLAVAGLGTWGYFLNDELGEQNKIIAKQIDELATQKNLTAENQAKADSLAKELDENNKKMKDYEGRIASMRQSVAQANARAAAAMKKAQSASVAVGTGGTEALKACAEKTYYIMAFLEMNGEAQEGSGGSGVLLSDGRLVTCLHVCHPFYMVSGTKKGMVLSSMMKSHPEIFSLRFIAISPNGDRFDKTYPLSSIPITFGSNTLRTSGSFDFEGCRYSAYEVAFSSAQDWASINIGKSGGLPYDNAWSKSLPIKTHLDILGFPQGVGAEDLSKVSPIFSESSVAREGLDVDGCILLSNSETDHGNSGGPVFAMKDGKYVVVGLLSGSNLLGTKGKVYESRDELEEALTHKPKDRVVPIGNTH